MRKAWWASAIAASLSVAACDRGGGRKSEVAAGAEEARDGGAPPAPSPGEARLDEATRIAPPQASRRAARTKRGATAAASVRRVEGKLERATSDRVVIRPPGQDPLTLRLGPGTSVTLDGRAARAESLAQGAEVRAAYRNDEGRARAISIAARTAPRQPPGELPADPTWEKNRQRGNFGGR